jgi:sialate O-acetylesterase
MKTPLIGARLFGVWILAFGISASVSRGEVRLPAVFGDHGVLQRDKPVPVWGSAAPGEKVEVIFGEQRRETTADSKGWWRVTLDALPASATPADLSVRGTNTITLHDILVGEVWLCSGQSNMEKPIGEQRGQKPVLDAEKEIAAANFPRIRLFKVAKQRLAGPGEDVNAQWEVCTPESIDRLKFSATGYFFGRRIHQDLAVPVGLIDSTWGGTRIEPWTPPEAFALMPSLAPFALAAQTSGVAADGSVPSNLFYGMIRPLAPYALRGFLWYQGESNLIDVDDRATYADKMEALIRGWRAVWGDAEAPFYYVQIAPHFYHVVRRQWLTSPQALPEFWEAQAAALRVKNTGMAATTDLVDDLMDIHPRDKQRVGERLARLALSRAYGRDGIVDTGPVLKRWDARDGKAVLTFDQVAGGLKSNDGKGLTWFEVAGADGRFFAAEAKIDGATVVVSSPYVAKPDAVRFGWDEAARPNLVNSAGLPAWPFRTDGSAIIDTGVPAVRVNEPR